MREIAVLIWMVVTIGIGHAAPASVQAEIDALLSKLQDSRCEFGRNGAWYSSDEARKHLLDKLKYLERNREVASAEQFIEQAASNSSFSGKPYRVRCAGAATAESGPWLLAQLKVLRAPLRAAVPPAAR